MNQTNPNDSSAGTTIGIIIVVLLAIIAGAYFMNNRPDNGNDTRIERAADELGDGVDDAADELSGREKSPGEKIGEAIEDAGENIKDSSQ
jgi:hypothetical protein